MLKITENIMWKSSDKTETVSKPEDHQDVMISFEKRITPQVACRDQKKTCESDH